MMNKITLIMLLALMAGLVSAEATSIDCATYDNGAVYWYGSNYTILCNTDANVTTGVTFGGLAMSNTSGLLNNSANWTITGTFNTFSGVSSTCDATDITASSSNSTTTFTYSMDNITTYPCMHTNTTGITMSVTDNNTVTLTFTGTKPTQVNTKVDAGVFANAAAQDLTVDTNQGDVNVSIEATTYNTTHQQMNFICDLQNDGTVICDTDNAVRQDSPYAIGANPATGIILFFGAIAGYAMASARRNTQ